jgi:hypothetical protein
MIEDELSQDETRPAILAVTLLPHDNFYAQTGRNPPSLARREWPLPLHAPIPFKQQQLRHLDLPPPSAGQRQPKAKRPH